MQHELLLSFFTKFIQDFTQNRFPRVSEAQRNKKRFLEDGGKLKQV